MIEKLVKRIVKRLHKKSEEIDYESKPENNTPLHGHGIITVILSEEEKQALEAYETSGGNIDDDVIILYKKLYDKIIQPSSRVLPYDVIRKGYPLHIDCDYWW